MSNQLVIDPRLQTAITWTLLDLGFARPDADIWGRCWCGIPSPTHAAAEAVAFDDHGIPISDAVRWHLEGFTAYEAISLQEAGWKSGPAGTVASLIGLDDEPIEEWAATGIDPTRIAAYLRAKIRIAEVHLYEELGPDLDQTLAALAALQAPRSQRAQATGAA